MSEDRAVPMHVESGATEPIQLPDGVELEWKITSEMSRGALIQFVQTNPPGQGVPMHIHHTDEESIYLLEGTLLFQLGDDVFEVRAGDMVDMPRGEPHGFKTIGETPTKVLFTLDLAPHSDYETMFRRLTELAPGDEKGLVEIAAANRCEFLLPLRFPESDDLS
jgi:quercetin dioxygenase-like cupin family protein